MAVAATLGPAPRRGRCGAAEDSQDGQQKQVPSRDTNTSSLAHIRDRLEIVDQIEIGCSRDAREQREKSIPPTSTLDDSSSKRH